MTTAYFQKARLFSRNMRLCLIFIAIFGFCYMGIYLVLLNLYLLRLGYGPQFVGLAYSVSQLVNAVSCLPAGFLGGRWGVRRAIIGGVCLGIAGLGSLPLAEFLPQTIQGVWITVMFSLAGLGSALIATNLGPFIMNATTPEERDHAYSVYFALVPLGAFAGSLVGGVLPGLFASALGVFLDSPAPYRYALWVAALLHIPALASFLVTREDRPADVRETVSEAGPAPLALIIVVALVMLLQFAASSVTSTFFNVYMDAGLEMSTAWIGTLAAIGQLLAVPAPLVVPLLVARWDRRHFLALGALGMALSLLPMALIPHWAAAGLGFIGTRALSMMWLCAIFPYIMGLRSSRWQAALSGAGTMAMGLSASVMALGGGYIVTTLGYRSLFLTGAGVTAAGALLFWIYFRVPRGALARHPTPDTMGQTNT